MAGAKIGIGVITVIGLVIFYAVYNAVNTDLWDGAVIALVGILALAMVVSGVLDIFGIKIKF